MNIIVLHVSFFTSHTSSQATIQAQRPLILLKHCKAMHTSSETTNLAKSLQGYACGEGSQPISNTSVYKINSSV